MKGTWKYRGSVTYSNCSLSVSLQAWWSACTEQQWHRYDWSCLFYHINAWRWGVQGRYGSRKSPLTQGCLGLIGPPCVTSSLEGTLWSKIDSRFHPSCLHSGQRREGREDTEQQVTASRLGRKLQRPLQDVLKPCVCSTTISVSVVGRLEVQRGMMLLRELGEDRHAADDAVTWSWWDAQM